MILRRLVLTLTLLIALALTRAPLAAQEMQNEIPANLVEQMQGLETATVALRGLQPTFEIARAFPTREETIAYLEDLFERDVPQEQLDRARDLYAVLGLMPTDLDLRQVYLDLLSSQVAGFYDTDTQTMNVIPLLSSDPGSSLSLTEQVIYVHEYTHALQDMHFDLDALLPDEIANNEPDRSLAITSLIEGDASAAMQLYMQAVVAENPLAGLSMLTEGALAGAFTPPTGIPEILTRELLFPYEQGLNFVTAVWGDGGWEAVDAAFASPPTTTEQVIHPAKFIAGEAAVPVEAGSADPGEGWTLIWETTLGEFYLREHLNAFAEFSTAASRAAAGWGGDAIRVWRSGDQRAFALRVAFDTPEDTAEFVEVYSEATGAFAPGCAAYLDGLICAAEIADGVVIAYAPDAALAQRLIA
ncbi:MAG: hypothetical protein JNL42_14385 [Anaerolineae bacterium]|nr:hypothetical protein [Anaerolineae bacterium]